MFQSIKLKMLDDFSWVELAYANGQLGTYYMKKSEEPNIFRMEDYNTGDSFDEFITRYFGSSSEGSDDEKSIHGDIDDTL